MRARLYPYASLADLIGEFIGMASAMDTPVKPAYDDEGWFTPS